MSSRGPLSAWPRRGGGAEPEGGAGRRGGCGGGCWAGSRLPLRLSGPLGFPRRCSAAYFAHEFRGRGSVASGRAAAVAGARRGWSRSAPGALSGSAAAAGSGEGHARIAQGIDTRARRAASLPPPTGAHVLRVPPPLYGTNFPPGTQPAVSGSPRPLLLLCRSGKVGGGAAGLRVSGAPAPPFGPTD